MNFRNGAARKLGRLHQRITVQHISSRTLQIIEYELNATWWLKFHTNPRSIAASECRSVRSYQRLRSSLRSEKSAQSHIPQLSDSQNPQRLMNRRCLKSGSNRGDTKEFVHAVANQPQDQPGPCELGQWQAMPLASALAFLSLDA